MQCTGTARYSGKRCRAHCLRGEDKCLMHSDSERARHERSKIKLMTKSRMVILLQRQLHILERDKTINALEKSKEIRNLIIQIDELISSETGERPTSVKYDEEGTLKFEKRVKESMEKDKENAK